MIYCYPKLSKYDLYFIRIFGPGLGNLLFPFARAIKFANEISGLIITPTWAQLKIGTVLRNEKDKRTYFRLFSPRNIDIAGYNKVIKLIVCNKVAENKKYQAKNNDIVVFDGMGDMFLSLKGCNTYIREVIISSLNASYSHDLIRNNNKNSIAVHVRQGDFSISNDSDLYSGKPNSRIPLKWYIDIISNLRIKIGNNVRVNIFSDSPKDQLFPLLLLENTFYFEEVNAIHDMLYISNHGILVASGSTFSMWAAFLGQLPSIWYKGQLQHGIYQDDNYAIEVGADGFIPDNFILDHCFPVKLK